MFAASLLALLPAGAQTPIAAGRSVAFDASVGYSYTWMNVPGSGSIGMIGPEGAFTADFLPRLGLRVDFSYQRSQDVFGSDHKNDAFTYLGGPVFYVLRKRHTVLFVEGLIGGARLSGVNNWQYGGYLTGFVSKPAWASVIGVQRAITPSISARLEASYLHTEFFNHAGAIEGSGSVRGSLTFVYSFGRGHRR